MVIEIGINEWACENCHAVFYTYLTKEEKALCPDCGNPTRYGGEVKFILRDGEFENVMDTIIIQDCVEGCWVYEDGITEHNEAEAREVIEQCAIRKLRRFLFGEDCPAGDC